MKQNLKEKAIKLRKQGLSYSEILYKIPVAKSTLSLWLRSVGLSKKQAQRLTEKKLASMKRGAEAKKQQRLNLLQKINQQASKDMPQLLKNPLWLSGIMLYWAEGSKEKPHLISHPAKFSNSDPKMIKVFLKWLKKIMDITNDKLIFDLYIHETGNVRNAKIFWAKTISCDINRIKVYFKKHKITKRKNIRNSYHGQLRISVRKSSTLNRKIAAWLEQICNYWGVV